MLTLLGFSKFAVHYTQALCFCACQMHLLHPSTVPHHYKQVLLCLLTSFDPRAVPHYNQVLLNSLTSLSSSAVLHRNRVLLCLLTSLVPSAIPIMTKSSHAFFDFTGVSLQCATQKPSPSVLTEFSSVQSRDRLGRRGGHEGRFSRDPLPVFYAGGRCEQFRHGQGCPLFYVVHLAFPTTTTESPTLQNAPKNGC